MIEIFAVNKTEVEGRGRRNEDVVGLLGDVGRRSMISER